MSEYSSTNLLQYYAGKPPAHLLHNPGFRKAIDSHIWNIVNGSGGGGGSVASVFGRTGTVVATTGDYAFSQIGSLPTTLAGYGITNAQAKLNATTKVTGVVASTGNFITGATTYVNAAMSGFPVLLFRNKLMEPDTNPGTGDSYFTLSGSTMTFSSALAAGELIQILILPV